MIDCASLAAVTSWSYKRITRTTCLLLRRAPDERHIRKFKLMIDCHLNDETCNVKITVFFDIYFSYPVNEEYVKYKPEGQGLHIQHPITPQLKHTSSISQATTVRFSQALTLCRPIFPHCCRNSDC